MAEPINITEWLSELQRLSRPAEGGAEGFATRDLLAAGWTDEQIKNRMRLWVARGLVAYNGKRHAMSIDGRSMDIPVYVLTAKAKGATPVKMAAKGVKSKGNRGR